MVVVRAHGHWSPCRAYHLLPGSSWPAGRATGEDSVTRHSVLYVSFDFQRSRCPIDNAQEAAPDAAYEYLKQGGSWCAIIDARPEGQGCLAWLMRVRQNPKTSQASLLVLMPDPGGPEGIAALRAGADVVLPKDVHANFLEAQIQRLRQRHGPSSTGEIEIGEGWMACADSRSIMHPLRDRMELPPQAFRLVWVLAAERGHLISIPILRLLLDIPARAADDTVHTAVAKLRRLLRPTGLAARVVTVRGAGYLWEEA